MKEFILKLVEKESSSWKKKPIVISEGLQDSLLLVFGKPRTVIFAHMDTIGFDILGIDPGVADMRVGQRNQL